MNITSDLKDFGYRELKMAAELLTAYCNQPSDFLGDGVHIVLNTASGYVFLSDEDYNVAMMEGDQLKPFHSCPECGAEGFADELPDQSCCQDYLAQFD